MPSATKGSSSSQATSATRHLHFGFGVLWDLDQAIEVLRTAGWLGKLDLEKGYMLDANIRDRGRPQLC
jgi:hypothetical protein